MAIPAGAKECFDEIGAGTCWLCALPHLEHEDHPERSTANAERMAAEAPVPTYAIDDETAIKVVDGAGRRRPPITSGRTSPE